MKNWNLRFGRVFGIPIEIHWTFWAFLFYIFLADLLKTGETRLAVQAVLTVLAIFCCVVLHEFGHALMALRFGVKTRDITLYLFGGVARLERIPERPREELLVAIAGPMVNVVIIMALLLIGVRMPASVEEPATLVKMNLLPQLLLVNGMLVAFNLLPAFPMDGGRIFRAILAMFMDYAHATRIAASLGQFMAILFGIAGLSGNPFLVFIALFVWLGASAEATSVEQKVLLGNSVASEAMLQDYLTVRDDETLDIVVKKLLDGSQTEFPVYHSLTGKPVGLLTKIHLFAALAQNGPTSQVKSCQLQALQQVSARRGLVSVLQEMRENGLTAVEVTDETGRVTGLLTSENLSEFLLVRSALKAHQG
jgi:Zn-dependent protease/CBS domain-containing protein